MWNTFGLGNMPVRAIDVVPNLECLMLLMPEDQRALLRDGGMSPRMGYMLRITAENEMDDDDCFGRLEYVSADILKRGRPEGLRSGLDACFRAIHYYFRLRGMAPTVERVQQHLETHRPGGDRINQQDVNLYFKNGGKVDYALMLSINVTRNVAGNGDDGWEYEMFEEDIEALPATELDVIAFDIARFKCINKGGGDGSARGP